MLEFWVDGDMIAYEALLGASEDIDWGDSIWTLHVDKNVALATFDAIVAKAIKEVERILDKTEIRTFICFTDSEHNFRKEIDPTYKGNRKGRKKPVGFHFLVEELRKHYNVVMRKGLEADDCIGIGMTAPYVAHPTQDYKPTRVIISGDKDMNTIAGWFYNYDKEELVCNTKEEAYHYFLKQVLTGDSADGYGGCPSYGKVKAEKVLKEDPSWQTVVKCYEEQGLIEEDAIRTARLAHILQSGDFDFVKKEVILWTPPESNG